MPRNQRRRPVCSRGIGKIFKFAKKVAKNPIVKELGKMALKELPGVYNKATIKIENKRAKILLQSDLANSLIDMGAAYGPNKLS